MPNDKYTPFKTPKGKARFPVLGREEIIKGKGTGKQGLGVIFEGQALEDMRAQVEDFIENTFSKKKAAAVVRPFKEDADGNVYLKITTGVTDKKSGEPKVVPLVDSKGNPIRGKIALGSGSVVRVTGSFAATEFGGKDYVKPWLNSIKVIRLVEYVPGGDWGSDDEDDDEDGEGYVADEFGDGASTAPSKKASKPQEDDEADASDEGDAEGSQDDVEPEPAPQKKTAGGRRGRADF